MHIISRANQSQYCAAGQYSNFPSRRKDTSQTAGEQCPGYQVKGTCCTLECCFALLEEVVSLLFLLLLLLRLARWRWCGCRGWGWRCTIWCLARHRTRIQRHRRHRSGRRCWRLLQCGSRVIFPKVCWRRRLRPFSRDVQPPLVDAEISHLTQEHARGQHVRRCKEHIFSGRLRDLVACTRL